MTGEMANPEQAAAWEGEAEHWATNSARYDRSVERHTRQLFAAAGISATDRTLDVGCGSGQCTREAARLAPEGGALGVDVSARMLERARQLATEEDVANVEFVHGDAQVHPLGDARYDIALSRFGAMFFTDPVAAMTNIARALQPGGRLALVAWQELGRNEWMRALRSALAAGRTLPQPPPNAPGPFGLADPAHVRRVLGDAGLRDVELAAVHEPIWFGADGEDAHGFVRGMGVARGLLQDLDPAERERALARLRQTFDDAAGPEGVTFATAAWLVTARRP